MHVKVYKYFYYFVVAANCSILLGCGSGSEKNDTSSSGQNSAYFHKAANALSLFAQRSEQKPGRDPFQLPVAPQVKKAARVPAAPLPVLTGIAFARGKAQAFFVLNGERIKASIGDTAGGYLVADIAHDRVTVKEKRTGKQYYILLSR